VRRKISETDQYLSLSDQNISFLVESNLTLPFTSIQSSPPCGFIVLDNVVQMPRTVSVFDLQKRATRIICRIYIIMGKLMTDPDDDYVHKIFDRIFSSVSTWNKFVLKYGPFSSHFVYNAIVFFAAQRVKVWSFN